MLEIAYNWGAAVALGATVIEKHFTMRTAEGGVDSDFPMEPGEIAQLVRECHAAALALGDIRYGPTEAELKSLVLRRFVYFSRDLSAGEPFTLDNLRVIRPGKGLKPKFLGVFLGRKASRDISRGTQLVWEHLS